MLSSLALGVRMQQIENQIPELEKLRYHFKYTFTLAIVKNFVWFTLLNVTCCFEILVLQKQIEKTNQGRAK